MKVISLRRSSYVFLFFLLITMVPAAWAQYWVSLDQDTRYMALGDSLTAGYAAHPATQGFAYRLYQGGVIDNINNMLFCNAGVPGSTSSDVLYYQVPQVKQFFKETGQSYRKVITLTVGGNDMLKVLVGADPGAVLTAFGGNLYAILGGLVSSFPDARIYVANQYDPMLEVPHAAELVVGVNQVIAGVVQLFPTNVVLVDVHTAFEGRSGLLLIERTGSEQFQVHPTNAGYGVMADAFEAAIRAK